MEKKDMVQKIRAQYEQKQETELDRLKALDARVKKPVKVLGWSWGTVGAIIMGAGMSLVMTDIGTTLGLEKALVPGIVIGILGLGMVLSNWPMCKRLLERRKKKYASQILELTDGWMK